MRRAPDSPGCCCMSAVWCAIGLCGRASRRRRRQSRSARGDEPRHLLVQRPGRRLRPRARRQGLGQDCARSPCEKSLSNFFQNLRFPIVAVNNLLQGKLLQSASDVGRFVVNTTVGVARLLRSGDRVGTGAAQRGLRPDARLLGRAAGAVSGAAVLRAVRPARYRRPGGGLVQHRLRRSSSPSSTPSAPAAVDIVNSRALVLREVRQLKQASFDYYVVVRNAYRQHRAALVSDQKEMSTARAGRSVSDGGRTVSRRSIQVAGRSGCRRGARVADRVRARRAAARERPRARRRWCSRRPTPWSRCWRTRA